jgi:hypothetical protein
MESSVAPGIVMLAGCIAVSLAFVLLRRRALRRLENAPRVVVPCLVATGRAVVVLIAFVALGVTGLLVASRAFGNHGIWVVCGALPALVATAAGLFTVLSARWARGHFTLEGTVLRWSLPDGDGRLDLSREFRCERRVGTVALTGDAFVQWSLEQEGARIAMHHPLHDRDAKADTPPPRAQGISLDDRGAVLGRRLSALLVTHHPVG